MEQVGAVGEQLGEDDQDRLVAQDHLPGRLQPSGRRVGEVASERLPEHPFPRVKLEEDLDGALAEVGEGATSGVPADPLDGDGLRLQARLGRRVAQVRDRHHVLERLLDRREGDVPAELATDAAPRLDQPLVDAVELVEIPAPGFADRGRQVLEPEPLDDRGLEEGGRGVRVVLQELGRPLAVERQVEPAVDRVLVALPALLDEAVEGRGDVELVEPLLLDDVADRLQAQRIEPRGRGLDGVDLASLEEVIGALVPVGHPVDRVEQEALRLDEPGPVDAGLGRDSKHRGGPGSWSIDRGA